jgi:hypothetical protein
MDSGFPQTRPAAVTGAVLGIAAVCAVLLAFPGQTVTTKYVNDLFVFLDGAHRVLAGQVPNRDFHSALGPLSYYLPAAGMWLGGSYGAAMPIGVALAVLALGATAALILRARLRPTIAIPLALYLLLVAAVPINLGEPIRSLSFAMFYNRIGWAALGLLLVMYVRPVSSGPGQEALDAVSAAALVLLLVYLKISYGLVGFAFLVLLLIDARQRRWAAAALALVVAACLAVEAVWRSSASHIADLMLAARVSGGVDGIGGFGEFAIRTLSGQVLFALVVGLALWCRLRVRDVLFYAFCSASGLMLAKQNFSSWEIVTLGAAAAVAVELACRATAGSVGQCPARFTIARGMPLLLLPLTLPSAIHNAAALGLHSFSASTRQGEPLPLPNFDRIRLTKFWVDADHPAMKGYAGSLEDGAAALRSLDGTPAGCWSWTSSVPSRRVSTCSQARGTAPGTTGAVRSTTRTSSRRTNSWPMCRSCWSRSFRSRSGRRRG